MQLTVTSEGEMTFVEGTPGEELITHVGEVDRLIEACFAEGAQGALLYAANMSPHFFDLSSGEAGVILQKLRTYRIRLALVCPPGSVTFSSRLGEMLADERRGTEFGIFDSREQAVAWLR